jgi:hypothetical protein
MAGADFEETIFHVRSTTKWVTEHEEFVAQQKDLTIPLSLLKSGSGGFLEWIFEYTNHLTDEKKVPTQKALKSISDRWFKVIDEYQFPVVTLSDDVKPDALCTIFETLNRTGVKLSVFELLTARFWPQNVNLRTLWDKAIKKYPIIKEYEVDPYYFLQAISLSCRPTPSCKRSEVLNLKASEITDWWERVVEGFATGLRILRDDCRVVAAKWLPYQTMVIPLAAVLAHLNPPRHQSLGQGANN